MSGSDDLGGLGDLDDADGDLGGLDDGGIDEGGEDLGGLDDGGFDQMADEEQSAEPQHPPKEADQRVPAETENFAIKPAEDDAGKPYLRTVPSGLGAELIVVEWLESLVEAVGRWAASRAIGYYESIDWISETVADRLTSSLDEFRFTAAGDGSLGAALHLQSLAFIEQLNGGDAGTANPTSVEVFRS